MSDKCIVCDCPFGGYHEKKFYCSIRCKHTANRIHYTLDKGTEPITVTASRWSEEQKNYYKKLCSQMGLPQIY